MSALDQVKDGVKSGLCTLQGLLTYLEERNQLGAGEYLYCQGRLRELVKQLKQLAQLAGANRNDS